MAGALQEESFMAYLTQGAPFGSHGRALAPNTAICTLEMEEAGQKRNAKQGPTFIHYIMGSAAGQ